LVERVRSSGIAVDVDVRLDPDVLPAEVALCAHRIVQEALTNVVRHAHARRVQVTIAAEQGTVIVQVVDDGHGAGPYELGLSRGHGLVGMRERLRMLDGELQAGDGTGGGFVVDARIPLAVSRD
jgi:signal transduction histidine kinase